MPELPDIELYLHALRPRVVGQVLRGVRPGNPFFLRSVDPPLREAEGKVVTAVSRIGKRILFELEDRPEALDVPLFGQNPHSHTPKHPHNGSLYLVLHMMIAGRLQWKEVGAKLPAKPLCTWTFDHGTLVLTEAGTKRRASLHLVRGREALAAFDRGGLEVMDAGPEQFAEVLRRENHTLKRTLTDPRLFSGIGNAYSDEILHRARLPPFLQTRHLDDVAITRLYTATRSVLSEWTERLRTEVGDGWPTKVTAFRPEMAVHGRFGRPCPSAAAPSSASSTPRTSATTAPLARPVAGSSPTAPSLASWEKTGPAPWKSLKNAASPNGTEGSLAGRRHRKQPRAAFESGNPLAHRYGANLHQSEGR